MTDSFKNALLTATMALIFGFLGAALWSYSGLADERTRAFLADNPDMLPLMAEAYQRQQASERLAELGDEVYAPFPGAVMGNPNGSRVLVEFTDYNCTFCEASLPDVARMIDEDPELKVVLREMPQFQGSEEAARMALAAAMQGKYRAFHETMFKMTPANAQSVEQAAQMVGLDMEQARADAMSEVVTRELSRNIGLAQALGFSGTPGWIAGDVPIVGYVGYEELKAALDESGV